MVTERDLGVNGAAVIHRRDEILSAQGGPLQHLELPSEPAELFRLLSGGQLSGLLLGNGPVSPPRTNSSIAAWTATSQSLKLWVQSDNLPAAQVQRVASRSCSVLEEILQPVLQPDDVRSVEMPSPGAVGAVAGVAAQATCLLPEGAATLSATAERLLSTSEECVELALELGTGSGACEYLLRLALAVGRHLKPVLLRCPANGALLLQDVAARMQTLLMGAAKLAEEEYAGARPPLPNAADAGDPLAKINALWAWPLDAPLDAPADTLPTRPAWALTRVLTEAAAVLLAAAWRLQRAEVQSTLVPLASIAPVKEALALLLGRLLALLAGDAEATRLWLPVLTDTLAARRGDVDAEVYAVAAHTLACMAGACATQDDFWGYSQVVDLLVKLYKFPQFSISGALLHGRPEQPNGAQRRASRVGDAAALTAPRVPPRAAPVQIRGRCPGALAQALHRLAAGLPAASLRYRKDLRLRLLSLFSDFALILPNDSYTRDLGALLPALAAACESFATAAGASRRLSSVMSATQLSLDALNSLQEEERALLRHFRHLWLHCSVCNFGGLAATAGPGAPPAWPAEWSRALSSIAVSTPVLLLGSEQQKAEAFVEGASAEFGSRLLKLGARGTPAAIVQHLTAAVGGAAAYAPLPAPLAAHLLTIAYKGVCRAAFQVPDSERSAASPVTPVLVHMRFSLPGAVEYPWLQQTLDKVFAVHASCLAACAGAALYSEVAFVALAAQETAQELTASLVPQDPRADLPRTAARLLGQLTEQFPGLRFNESVVGAALEAVAEDEVQNGGGEGISHDGGASFTPQEEPVRRAHAWMLQMATQAARTAPGPTEAVITEHMRHLIAKGGRHAAIAVRFMPEVLQAVQRARTACPLPDVVGPYKGLMAWSAKMHALGVVHGFAAVADDRGEPGSAVVARCTRALLTALSQGAASRALILRYAEAAAALIQYEVEGLALHTLQLLAWLPLRRFSPPVLQGATMVWHWVLAASGAEVREAAVAELADAWLATRTQRLGIFSRTPAPAGGGGQSCTSNGSATLAENSGSSVDGSSGGGEEDPEALLQGIVAHHAWVVFFIQLWRARRHDLSGLQPALTAQYWRLLAATLCSGDHCLVGHPAAAAARFRLLHLALSFVCAGVRAGGRVPAGFDPLVLYQGILRATLDWFAGPVAWHEAGRAASKEAADAVRAFASLLRDAPPLVCGGGHALRQALESPETELAALLLAAEVERLSVWAYPLQPPAAGPTPAPSSLAPSQWDQLAATAWGVSPLLATALQQRFAGVPALRQALQRLVRLHAAHPGVHALPQAVQHLATPEAAAAAAAELRQLASWAPVTLLQAMSLISTSAGRHPTVLSYLLRSLATWDPDQVAFFLPQLVQMLRHDPGAVVEDFLLAAALRSAYFAYLLDCQLASEGTPPEEAFSPAVRRSNWAPPSDSGLWAAADRARARLRRELTGHVKAQLDAELAFFDAVTEVSGRLYPVPKELRKAEAVKLVKELSLPREDLFMPTNAHARVVAAKPETAAPMQSAAKCPILVAFDVEEQSTRGGASVPAVQALIFKVGDDCRQDVLALQVISLLKAEFDRAGLALPLVPYGVVPTGHECGIIEVVPHAKSRAQLGELTEGGLFDVFQHEFGLPGSRRFEAARAMFTSSAAAYSVASYLLQAKDRHNGNIMLNNLGALIHIDFGYILGISPGGNMGFESAAFKLSYEMTELLDPGGTRASPNFRRFQELCVKGYLAARSVADGIIATVAMAEPSQLPCFGLGRSVSALRERFHLEMSEAQAAAFMRGLIVDAYDKWTTGVYDLIQWYQNKIPK